MSAPTERPGEVGPGLSGARILVVEDDAGHVEAIRRAFEKAGSKVTLSVVRTLGEFRRAKASGQPDIALVDFRLPDGRAIELLTNPPEEGSFPILVMTSFGDEQTAVEAMKAGALDYVVKSPEAFGGMPRTVERALGQWRVLQEKRAAEIRSRRLTRVYLLLADINQAIVRIRDLEVLFPEACRIAVEKGAFLAALIALQRPDSKEDLLSWKAGSVIIDRNDLGPAASTVQTGERSICNDVRSDPAGEGWRDLALRKGFLAWAVLPLKVQGATVGSFSLISSEPGVFDDGEMKLLDELSMDLSFAIELNRRETARGKAEAEIVFLNASLEAKVRDRTVELQEANRELESFNYSVSHDLRAPLRAIDGFSKLLVEDYGNRLDEGASLLLARIRGGVKKMSRLVDDLLALSRLGHATLSRMSLDLGRIASEVDAELRAANPERQVDFVLAGDLGAEADKSLVEILLRNILGNAWKFASKKPSARIEIGVEE